MKYFNEININSKKYILVDKYEYKGDKLFHFGALSLDDEIFCKKENDKYIPITDEYEIAVIKNKFKLIKLPYYYDEKSASTVIKKVISQFKVLHTQSKKYKTIGKELLALEDKEKICKEQIDNFKRIKEKFNLDINIEDVINKINKVKIFKVDKFIGNRCEGIYKPKTNSIIYRKEIIDKDSITNKAIRLHEFIHAITGKKSILIFYIKGLIEGETENLAKSIYNDNTSSVEYNWKKDKIQYNFPKDTTYKNLVTLVQQMEYVIGSKSYESILKGNMSFENKFAKEYGVQLMTFMAYRINRLHNEEYGISINKILGRSFNETKYLKETQDILMENVFDKDFEKVENLEDAKKYLEKLKNFETVRAKISTFDSNKNEEIKDISFKEYYNKKLEDISKKLEEKGISKESINTELEQYQYEEQQYKPMFTEQEFMKIDLIQGLGREIIRNNHIIDINDYTIKTLKMSNGERYNNYNYIVIKKATNEGYFINRDCSGNTRKIFENMSQNERNTSYGNLTDKIKLLKDNGFEDIEMEINTEEMQNGIVDYIKNEIEINESRIREYKEKNKDYLNHLITENEKLTNLLRQYDEKNKKNSSMNDKIIEEDKQENSSQNKDIKKFPKFKISMKNLVKNALGKYKIKLEEVESADRVELEEYNKENIKAEIDK